MPKLDLFLNSLRQAGLRVTAQRRAICEYLATAASHPTPYQVYQDVSAIHPEISRATVYNTLNTLQQLGVIVEMSFGSDHTHYETDLEPHINLICLRCQTVQDYAHDVGSAGLYADVQEAVDFQPVAARVDMLGFCSSCRAQRRAEIVAQWDAEHGGSPAKRTDPEEDIALHYRISPDGENFQ